MDGRALLDTDVIVEHLRGREQARQFVRGLQVAGFASAVTVAELFAGVKGEEEEDRLRRLLHAFEILPVTPAAAELAGAFRRTYGRSHGTGLTDALIAAAAETQGATLYTFYVRHFPMLRDVRAPYKRVPSRGK